MTQWPTVAAITGPKRTKISRCAGSIRLRGTRSLCPERVPWQTISWCRVTNALSVTIVSSPQALRVVSGQVGQVIRYVALKLLLRTTTPTQNKDLPISRVQTELPCRLVPRACARQPQHLIRRSHTSPPRPPRSSTSTTSPSSRARQRC